MPTNRDIIYLGNTQKEMKSCILRVETVLMPRIGENKLIHNLYLQPEFKGVDLNQTPIIFFDDHSGE